MRTSTLVRGALASTLVLVLSTGAGLAACGGGSTSSGSGASSTSGTAGGGGVAASATSTDGASSSATGSGGAGGASGATGGTGTGGKMPTVEYDCSASVGMVPMLKLTEVASGFSRPVLVKPAPDDDTRLYVLGAKGQIYIIQNGATLPTPFLDISAMVHQPSGGDERGLLGLAFHPKYQQNGRFFVYYTDTNTQNGSTGDQHVAEFHRSMADPNVADPAPVSNLFTQPDVEANHNGGNMAFSPKDGFLYIGMGDGGGANDQHGTFGNGQNLATRWGKLLRIDIDSAMKPYGIPAGNMTTIPAGNPTQGAVLPEIWDFGLRNPWRFSFDLCTNDLYIGDVGQGKWEEIDVEPAGQGNKNYGWRLKEGTHDFLPENYDTSSCVPPVAEYPHNPECSVTGGYVYRAAAIPGLRGMYFYGDYCSGAVWMLSWAGGVATAPVMVPELNPGLNVLVSFGQDNLGNVYVVAINGKIYRIDAA